MNLDRSDAQRLADDVEQWRASILSVYLKEGTAFIKENTVDSVFSESTLDDEGLDKMLDSLKFLLDTIEKI